jgi:hypothetical protein
LDFFGSQLKHKVSWKSGSVTLHLLIEPLRGHAIQSGQIGVEHNFVTTKQENRALNTLAREYVGHQKLLYIRGAKFLTVR